MEFTFDLNGEEHRISLIARKPRLTLRVDGRVHHVSDVILKNKDQLLLTIDGHRHTVWRARGDDHIHLKIGLGSFTLKYKDPLQVAQQGTDGDDVLKADMPGVVVSVHCEGKTPVVSGDILMVIESMKMQINIVAPRDGIIEAVQVGIDETFEKGASLISLEVES